MSNLKLNINPIKILFIFLIFNQSFILSIPPETDFLPLNSRELSYFSLTKEKSEIYYSFNNIHAASDIILEFKIAKGFTSHCYIYDSYSSIKQDEQGLYINALKEFAITENSNILKQSELSIKKAKYYIIIKDIIKSFYKDYILVFNEEDLITLTNGQYIQFNQFYSKKTFNLFFSHKKNEVATLQLNTDNADFVQLITIYSGDEVIYMGEKNRGEIKLNEQLDNEGNYTIKIESDEEPYVNIKTSLVLNLDQRKSKELLYSNPLRLSYNGNKEFNFYVDLSQYELNEENIITFKFGNQVLERNLISHCYAKAINLESNDDNKIVANMPAKEDENEAIFSLLTGTNDVYQLYFKNTQEKVENKTTYLLIHLSLQIGEYDTSEFLEPEEFCVFISNKPEKINLIEYKDKTHFIYNKNIQLENYIPLIYKITFPNEEYAVRFSYIFYTSEQIQTVYNTTMLNSEEHKHEKKRILYSISPSQNEYDYTKTLYIKLYGFSSKEINFRIESTESVVYYIHNDFRKVRTFSDKLTDCSKSFYYIGDYGSLVTKGYFYQETLYGKINTYYKGKINPEDKSILINEEAKYLIDNLFPLETALDIIELKCEKPGFYQAHLVDDVDTRNINLYHKVYNYLPSKKNCTIIPVLNPIEEDINFEIYNPKGKTIKISDGEKIETLDNNKKYYQIKYNNYSFVPNKFTVVSDEDSIISITLTNKNPFVIIDQEKTDVDYDSQIIVKLPPKTDYTAMNIEITRIYHGYSFSLFRGNVDFAGKLIESEYDYIQADRSHKIKMTISNPYLIEPNNNINNLNDDIIYYLIYSIDDPEQIQKEVKLSYKSKEDHEKINPEEEKIIHNENDVYTLPAKNISLIFQSCGNSLKEILIEDLWENILQTIPNSDNNTKYNYDKVINYNTEVNMNINFKKSEIDNDLKGAVIGITEKAITEERIKYYTDLKLKIKIEDGKLTWEKIDQMNNYDIYVLDENNSYIPFLDNPCLLEAFKNNFSENPLKDNNTYIKHYSSNVNFISLKEQGIYTIAISSNIENDIPLVYIYEPFVYNSSNVPPSSDEDDDDGADSGTILFVAIALPIVVIGVVVLIFSLIKCKKKKEEDNINTDNGEIDDRGVSILNATTSRVSEV